VQSQMLFSGETTDDWIRQVDDRNYRRLVTFNDLVAMVSRIRSPGLRCCDLSLLWYVSFQLHRAYYHFHARKRYFLSQSCQPNNTELSKYTACIYHTFTIYNTTRKHVVIDLRFPSTCTWHITGRQWRNATSHSRTDIDKLVSWSNAWNRK
jgi:hypothetical protein